MTLSKVPTRQFQFSVPVKGADTCEHLRPCSSLQIPGPDAPVGGQADTAAVCKRERGDRANLTMQRTHIAQPRLGRRSSREVQPVQLQRARRVQARRDEARRRRLGGAAVVAGLGRAARGRLVAWRQHDPLAVRLRVRDARDAAPPLFAHRAQLLRVDPARGYVVRADRAGGRDDDACGCCKDDELGRADAPVCGEDGNCVCDDELVGAGASWGENERARRMGRE